MFCGLKRMESTPDFNLGDDSESADVIYMDECDAGDNMRQWVLQQQKQPQYCLFSSRFISNKINRNFYFSSFKVHEDGFERREISKRAFNNFLLWR